MARQVSVERIFEDNQARLGLHWVAGRQGGNRVLTGEQALKPTIGQVGHMNFIHPFRVQILGAAEVAFLRALPETELQASIDRLFTLDLVAIVVANGEAVPARLAVKCDAQHIGLFTSIQPSPHLVEVFRLYLARVLLCLITRLFRVDLTLVRKRQSAVGTETFVVRVVPAALGARQH